MPFNLNEFQNNLAQYGISSVNKFDVNINLPKIFNNATFNNALADLPDILRFRAQSINLPAIALISHETNRYGLGPIVKQPYNAAFGDIRTTFIGDKQGLIYLFFYFWFNGIYNFSETNTSSGTASQNLQNFTLPSYTSAFEDDVISSSIDINIYDNTGTIIQTVNALRAKPTIFTASPLSWDQTNTLFKMNVNFSFREWTISFPQNNP